jgi:NADPH:quinone reductase-like Zn-dependent oxidoreductase
MKAVLYHHYGSPDVLRLEEVPSPEPKSEEVLVKIVAASVNAADWHLLRADPFLARLASGLFKPKNKILGADIAGVVEAVGPNASQYRIGDHVFGDISGCGFGGFAEYASVRESALALKPSNISFEEAAAVPLAALTALQGLRDAGRIKPGLKVLINGASGGVGTFAVQLAKDFGTEVTAVCSTAKLDLVRTLGADHVIDYKREDFTRSNRTYDLILAANGFHPITAYRRALAANGVYVMTGGAPAQMYEALLFGPLLSLAGTRKMGALLAKANQKDLVYLAGMLEAGRLKPVIDKKYTLAEVPEAIRYVDDGHAFGKVVIIAHV